MEVDDDELLTLYSEQRNELTAAKITESDLEYAFQLQMHEAINASIALQPSSSSSPPDFHFLNDEVSVHGLAHLLDEELERFERERSDAEQVKDEMRRMQDDLNRLIHDQSFARELEGVPEEEWLKTGDVIEKPYVEGSFKVDDNMENVRMRTSNVLHKPYGEGSSKQDDSMERFRMYIKGLVKDVMIENARTSLIGIGVVICDSIDTPIFEVGKHLIGVESSGEVAEMKALIEGLNAAVTLGIKRISVFSDDDSLYQYITGKWVPNSHSQIRTLVDQVTLLQRKFIQCIPSPISGNNVNFAFKHAHEAINSQSAHLVEDSRGKNTTETCVICFEDTDINQMFSVSTCLHRYCVGCIQKHVEAKFHRAILPKCPHEGCESEMNIDSCRNFLPPELFDDLSQKIKEATIPTWKKIYCPYPKCSALMSKDEILQSSISADGRQMGPQVCTRCHGSFCMHCQVPWHINMSCDNYKRLNPYPSWDDGMFKNLATWNRWRQCVKCKHMIELAEGCYHIYCRCGHEFCYICGADRTNKQRTCKCPLWDEQNIIHNA